MSDSTAPSRKRQSLFTTNRRRHPRLAQECLQSSLGPISNLSLGGAHILCRQAPTEELLDLMIDDGLGGEPLEVRARVVRCERAGWRKHTVGVEFIEVDEAGSKRLMAMAASGRFFQPD